MALRANTVGHTFRPRVCAVFAAAAMLFALAGCGSGDSKTYDISPIFPLSAGKCANYNGTADGTGINAHCWVTKSECERAAADWRSAMANLPDAIEFRC